jgi:hypothetical protein
MRLLVMILVLALQTGAVASDVELLGVGAYEAGGAAAAPAASGRDPLQLFLDALRGIGDALTGLASNLVPRASPPAARKLELLARARALHRRLGTTIARLLGSADVPRVTFSITDDPVAPPAATSGTDVVLAWSWFEHREDDGAIVHELAHAIHRSRQYDQATAWLVEGIADWVRDLTGHAAPHSRPRHVPGGATQGYQSTAHFLIWLDRHRRGGVTELARALARGDYRPEESFSRIFGAPLHELVRDYDASQADPTVSSAGHAGRSGLP